MVEKINLCNKKQNIYKSDIIMIDDYKFIVYNIGTKYIELLPISQILESEHDKGHDIVPRMKLKKNNISKYKKIDNFEIYLLMNNKNSLIIETIAHFLENET